MLCIDCGFHLKLKKKLDVGIPLVAALSNLYEPTRTNADGASIADTLNWLFWIEGRVSRFQWWMVQVVFYTQWFVLVWLAELQVIPHWLVLVIFFPSLWISIAVQVRRWHDLDKTGFWCFVHFVPIVGTLYAWIDLALQRGSIGYNQFGADPITLPRNQDS